MFQTRWIVPVPRRSDRANVGVSRIARSPPTRASHAEGSGKSECGVGYWDGPGRAARRQGREIFRCVIPGARPFSFVPLGSRSGGIPGERPPLHPSPTLLPVEGTPPARRATNLVIRPAYCPTGVGGARVPSETRAGSAWGIRCASALYTVATGTPGGHTPLSLLSRPGLPCTDGPVGGTGESPWRIPVPRSRGTRAPLAFVFVFLSLGRLQCGPASLRAFCAAGVGAREAGRPRCW